MKPNLPFAESALTSELDPVNFSDYRNYCDLVNPGTRKNGLLSASLFEEAMNDSDSITLDIPNLGKVPVLVPIKYVEGYDTKRAEALARSTIKDQEVDTYYWCYPSIELNEDDAQYVANQVKAKGSSGSSFAFYFDFSDKDTLTAHNINKLEEMYGEAISYGDIREQNAPVDMQAPQIIMHSFLIHPGKEIESGHFDNPAQSYDDQVAKGLANKWPNDGFTVCSGDQMPDKLKNELWDLYKDRFSWLGANHPISMEDTEEEFIETLSAPETFISIAFEHGKPKCMVYASENTSASYWLNADVIQRTSVAGAKDIYFIGLVADIKGTTGFGYDTLTTLGKHMYDTGQSYRVLFESTNLSDAYVPKMVQRSSEKSGFVTDKHAIDDVTSYKLATFASNQL